MTPNDISFVMEHAPHAAFDIAAKSIIHGNDLWQRFRDAGLYRSFDHARFASTAMSICAASDPRQAKLASEALTEHLAPQELSKLMYDSSNLSPLLRQIVVINVRRKKDDQETKMDSIDALLSTFVQRGADLGRDISYSSGSQFVKSNVLGHIAFLASMRAEDEQEAYIDFARVFAKNGVSWTDLEDDQAAIRQMTPRKNAIEYILSDLSPTSASKWLGPIFDEAKPSPADIEKALRTEGVQSHTAAMFQARMALDAIGSIRAMAAQARAGSGPQ